MNLEGLNYDSKLSIDDLTFNASVQEQAILDRTTIIFGGGTQEGAPILPTPQYGINPAKIIASDTTRPLLVTADTNTALTIDVNPGTTVSPNGCICTVPTAIQALQLARTLVGDIIVVYTQNQIVDSAPVRITRYGVAEPVRRTQNTQIVNSALLSDFTNPVLFPPSVMQNIVSLAVVTVVQTQTGLELQIDLSASTYVFNRPWYSPVDVQHRSYLGTGVATENNPHATSFNDLSSGNLTLYQEVLPYGMVQSRDDAFKGMPGYSCTETVTPSRILTDTGGTITAQSRFGGVGAQYVVLSAYPWAMGSMYSISSLSREIAFDWIKGTRILVLPASEVLTEDAIIAYTRVTALEPPASLLSNTITLGQPNISEELIYTGGLAVSTLTNPSIAYDGSGPVPRNFTIYANSDGSLLSSPGILQPTVTLDAIGTNINALTIAQFGPAHLSVGLANAVSGPNLSVVITLYGVDNDNNNIQETVTFGSSWVPASLPGTENLNQYIVTNNVFASLTGYQVVSRANDGPNSQIIIYAEYQSEITPALNNLAQAVGVAWSGLSISSVVDLRHVVRAIPEIPNRYQAIGEAYGIGGTSPTFLLSEDFAAPQHQETTTGSQAATSATFNIDINDFSLIQTSDTITLPNGSTLSPVLAPSIPNRTLGQFLASVSNQSTRDDMIATLNYSGFSSGVTAVADINSNVAQVDCTSTTKGSAGNGTVTTSLANPNCITTSGAAVGGYDTFGQIHLVRHWDYINSTIPSSSVYEVSYLQSRYQSRAIATDGMNNLMLVAYGVPQPYASKLQVRMRVAQGTFDWNPWQVVTGNGNSYTLSAPGVTKVQIELFGRCSGFSLYEWN
jgi:hypothetical protein